MRSTLKARRRLAIIATILLIRITDSSGQPATIPIDFQNYDKSCGVIVSEENGTITVHWSGGEKTIYLSFKVQAFRSGINMNPQVPLIQSVVIIEINDTVEIFSNLQPEYALFLGSVIWKSERAGKSFSIIRTSGLMPSKRPCLIPNELRFPSTGHRATLSFEGLKAGVFEGDLNFTFYDGDALV